jgi:hypothetical protein
MSTPDNRPDASESPLDHRLREAFDFLSAPPGTVLPPPAHLWAGVEAGMRPPTVRKPAVRPQVQAGLLGLLAGMLLMLGVYPKLAKAPETRGNHREAVATTRKVIEGDRKVIEGDRKVIEGDRKVIEEGRKVIEEGRKMIEGDRKVIEEGRKVIEEGRKVIEGGRKVIEGGRKVIGSGAQLAASPRKVISPDTLTCVPVLPSPMVVTGLQAVAVPAVALPFVQTEQTLLALGTDTTRTTRERRRDALLMQRAALVRLQFRTDSLLLALGEPTATATAVAASDSTPVAPLKNRWSVALSFAPERNFFGLNAPAADTLAALRRTHEQGRAGWNAAVMAEYRLDQRWSVGAGVGLTSYGAELRLTDRQTAVTVTYDTQTSQNTQNTHIENTTYSIREDSTVVLSPIFNTNLQIIGYDTLYIPRPDTVWTHVITDGTVVTNTITTRPTVTQRHEVSTRVLRPNYRFVTIPLLVRYRFGTEGGVFGKTAASRWWTDVALGAQVQLFLGGTQLSSVDGRTWHTERVRPGEGPFRPLTVALTGALALNYALTPRLSASLSPTVRYQTESMYKASTGLTQRPAATGIQMGLRLAF